MQRQGLCAFMLHWNPDDKVANENYTVTISFSDNLTEKQVHKMMIQHVMQLAIKHNTVNLTDLFHAYLG
jgi:hypothetical protein